MQTASKADNVNEFFFFFFIWKKYFKMPSAELFYHAASDGKARPSHSRIQIIAVALCLHILSWLTNLKQSLQ